MSQIIATTKRRRLRRNTYIWMLSTLAVTSALIYWEQTALLYALSTLAMCILLLVVACSNIEGRDREVNQPAQTDDAAITESNVTAGRVLSGSCCTAKDHKAEGGSLKTLKAVLFMFM